MLLGSHVSISGGVNNACFHAKMTGSSAIQIFTKNQVQWAAGELDEKEINGFKVCVLENRLTVIAHLAYLINLGSNSNEIEERSISGFINEIKRCHLLGINQLIFHPGSNKYLDEKETIKKISLNLKKIIKETSAYKEVLIAIETTAGQGYQVGYKLEHIKSIIDIVESQRITVCIDTCHIFTAGYDIRTIQGYNSFIDNFDKVIGLNKLSAIHLNDSAKTLGSRVDRHANIGKGFIGKNTFKYIMNDNKLKNIPIVIETPGNDEGHKIEIELLKSLV
jgi:deoxyribonuclease-4